MRRVGGIALYENDGVYIRIQYYKWKRKVVSCTAVSNFANLYFRPNSRWN